MLPSVLVAHTLAVPDAIAVTRPDEFTTTIAVLLDDQFNVLLFALDGIMVEDNCVVAPGVNDAELGAKTILVIVIVFVDTDMEIVLDILDPSVL